jgi:D-alanine-D-alanine ligase-like ATP-grasp enzyme
MNVDNHFTYSYETDCYYLEVSAEHEVSIISGLQIVEAIDRAKYATHVIYLTKDGCFQYLKGLSDRKDFKSIKPQILLLVVMKGSFFMTSESFLRKHILMPPIFRFTVGSVNQAKCRDF